MSEQPHGRHETLDATAAAEYFLAGARDGGMEHVCISPGSRSTPLAVAALRTAGITTSVHIDERVGGFSALGRAIEAGRPVGLICTSGTAGANYLPAIAEAAMSNVPLVVMTADRPPEHQSWGVGQTFDQTGLFHRQVRHEFAMPVGGDGGAPFSHRAGWRAATTATEAHGPVHVNWPFRLPLEPANDPQNVQPSFHPPARVEPAVNQHEVDALSQLIQRAQHPIIIAGPHTTSITSSGLDADRLCDAASNAGVPILADVLSGLRGRTSPALIEYPALVTERNERDDLHADLIIHVGHTPTAKRLRLWWESIDADHVLIDPKGEWHDPSHVADHRFTSDPLALLSACLAPITTRTDHLRSWVAAGERTAEICAVTLDAATSLDEPAMAATLGVHTTANDLLVASSSMPVRDLDTFLPVASQARVHANRGINGIDGVVATAAGMAAVRQNTPDATRTICLIGDIALLHDIGGVLDAARHGVRLTIVVPNNDGGGIFSFLPARDALDETTFDELFHTPHGNTFDFLKGYPGIHHVLSTNLAERLDYLAMADEDDAAATVTIIEIATDADARVTSQQRLVSQLRTT